MLKRAIGYEYEEKEITADKTGKPGRVRITKKHMPPDINAIKYIMSEDYNNNMNYNKKMISGLNWKCRSFLNYKDK